MKIELQLPKWQPQGSDEWCGQVSTLIALKARGIEKYNENFSISEKLEIKTIEKDFYISDAHGQELWDKIRDFYKFDFDFVFEYSNKPNLKKIEKYLRFASPCIISIDKWGIDKDFVVPGQKRGHFFVVLGVEHNGDLILANPWGFMMHLQQKYFKKLCGSMCFVI